MKYGLYSIRDKMSGYGVTNCQVNDEIAKRNFDMLVMDENATLLSTHPQDFELYCVGEFDSDTGKVTSFDQIRLICKGDSYVKAKK